MSEIIKVFNYIKKKIPKSITNFIIFLFYVGILYVAIIYLIPSLTPFISWASQRKFVIIQSLGSTATAIAVLITLWDIRKRQEKEQIKFLSEAEPFVTLRLLSLFDIKYSDEIDGQVYLTEGHLISNNFSNLFEVRNSGKRFASNVNVYICQNERFDPDDTISDGPMELASNDTCVISKLHFYKKQNLKVVDWFQNFYIKVEYESKYLNNRFAAVFKADVKLILDSQKTVDSSPNKDEVVNIQVEKKSIIHNIVPIYNSKIS